MRVVTIDGPAGAGKSTVSKLLAERLGWRLLDTGAMYRAVTLAALRADLDLSSDEALDVLAGAISLKLLPGQILLNGVDVSPAIRSVEVTQATRHVADSPSVRRRLVTWQREFAAENDVIAEGRDQGTVVFPDAFCKFFLTANLEERARRRGAEFSRHGKGMALENVLNDLRARDETDEARAIAPMRPAPDALIVDTTGHGLDDVVDRLEREVVARLGPLEPEPKAAP